MEDGISGTEEVDTGLTVVLYALSGNVAWEECSIVHRKCYSEKSTHILDLLLKELPASSFFHWNCIFHFAFNIKT